MSAERFFIRENPTKSPKNLFEVSPYRKDGTRQLSSVLIYKHTWKCIACINPKIQRLAAPYIATSTPAFGTYDPPTHTPVFLRSVLYENASIFYTWRRVIRAKPSRVHREILHATRIKRKTLLWFNVRSFRARDAFFEIQPFKYDGFELHVRTHARVSVRGFGIHVLIRIRTWIPNCPNFSNL